MAQADSTVASMDADEPAVNAAATAMTTTMEPSWSSVKAAGNDAKSQLPWVEKYRPEK
jgi:hypothetical protein